jgi:hypothetical protein
MKLIKRGRLSVQPVTDDEYNFILSLEGNKNETEWMRHCKIAPTLAWHILFDPNVLLQPQTHELDETMSFGDKIAYP